MPREMGRRGARCEAPQQPPPQAGESPRARGRGGGRDWSWDEDGTDPPTPRGPPSTHIPSRCARTLRLPLPEWSTPTAHPSPRRTRQGTPPPRTSPVVLSKSPHLKPRTKPFRSKRKGRSLGPRVLEEEVREQGRQRPPLDQVSVTTEAWQEHIASGWVPKTSKKL